MTKPRCDVDGGEVLRNLLRFLLCHEKPTTTTTFRVVLTLDPYVVQFEGAHFMADIPIDRTATAEIMPVDAAGNPSQIEAGTAVWSSSDEAVATVAADPANELKAKITMVGPVSVAAQIKMECDADRGAGVVPVVFIGDINGIAGNTVGGVMNITIDEAPPAGPT